MSDAPNCAVFDLDGTLVETAPDLVAAASETLAPLGIPPLPLEVARTTAGYGARALMRAGLELAGRSADDSEIEDLVPTFLDLYEARISRDSHLYDGVEDALNALSEEGWRLAVCTNKPEYLARILLEDLKILGHFHALVGSDTFPVRKPDPLPYREVTLQAGGTIERSFMIGDTDTDLKTARAARRPCILTSFGYSPVPVATFKPDHVAESFPEIVHILAAITR